MSVNLYKQYMLNAEQTVYPLNSMNAKMLWAM